MIQRPRIIFFYGSTILGGLEVDWITIGGFLSDYRNVVKTTLLSDLLCMGKWLYFSTQLTKFDYVKT